MPAPEIGSFRIDRMDHQRTSADQLRGRRCALQRVLDETGADASARASPIRGELPKKQTWNGVGRLAGLDRPGQDGGHHGGRGETIETDHPFRLVDDEDSGEAFRLVAKGACLEPLIEERLAAIEIGKLMLLGQRFRPRQEQASGFRLVTGLPRRGTVRDRDDLRDRLGRLGQN